MNGVLENMIARLDRLEQLVAASQQQQPAQPAQQQVLYQPEQQQAAQQFQQPQFQQPAQPQFQQPAQPQFQGQQQVTADMIANFVTPLVVDPAYKAAFQQEMSNMGITQGLPSVQPHQYTELYQRFLNAKGAVDAQRGGGQQPQAPVQQAAPSII